jgi:hypothetical protein
MSPAVWIVLWVAAALGGEVAALLPLLLDDDPLQEPAYVVFRLVGGSFTACGLVAWHRRPATTAAC